MCKQRTNGSAGLFFIVISYAYVYVALKNLKGIISTNVEHILHILTFFFFGGGGGEEVASFTNITGKVPSILTSTVESLSSLPKIT